MDEAVRNQSNRVRKPPKAKTKLKKQTDRHSAIDNPHRGFIDWLDAFIRHSSIE